MFVVDFMHECKLGTWKALFTHLLRLLHALPQGSQLIMTLDSRFCQVPVFGNGMKWLAAHDFKVILQCAIPAFEGLFPGDHDTAVLSLLYQFAQWHALMKLRMHSESTITLFEETFKKATKKLHKAQQSEISNAPPESNGTRAKEFNLNTYKLYAMGDYVSTIRFFRTTDSFTTQIVCMDCISTLHLSLTLASGSLPTGC
ncbi:hypothetical protein BDR04DRAFT_1128772 [Suillus decipiens]|nr:hypothetical protein BDR04DRAFT_1128772 [Suillus decipiens]